LFLFPIFPNAIVPIAIGVYILLFILNVHNYSKNQSSNLGFFLFTGFYLIWISSIFWSENKLQGFNEIRPSLYLMPIIYIFWYFKIVISYKYLKILKSTFIFSLVLYFFQWARFHIEGVSLFQTYHLNVKPLNSYGFIDSIFRLIKLNYSYYGYISEWGYFRFGKTPELFIHYTYISLAILLALCFLYQLFVQSKSKFVKLFFLTIFLFLSFFLFQLPSKVNIVLFISTVLFVIFFKLRFWPRIYFLIVLMSVSFIYKDIIIDRLNKFRLIQWESNRTDNGVLIDYQRLEIYKVTINAFKSNPILGVGIGDLDSLINNTVVRNKNFEGTIPINNISLNAHSEYLHCLAATGIVGFIFFCIFLAYNITFAFQHRKYIYCFFGICLAVNCAFENIFSRSWGVFIFLIAWISMMIDVNLEHKRNKHNFPEFTLHN
jgi:O-antigen ligase